MADEDPSISPQNLQSEADEDPQEPSLSPGNLQLETDESKIVENDAPKLEEPLGEHVCPLSPFPIESDNEEASNERILDRLCAVCGAGKARRCSNCKQISYCGKEHQIEHWKIHKERCFPVTVVDRLSPAFETPSGYLQGRSKSHGLIATRDIKQGEVFFHETVILTSPGPWDPEAIEVAKGRPICVSCCEIIKGVCDFDDDDDEDGNIRCSQCHWPVCNHFCETAKRHSDYECKVLSTNHVSSMVLNQMPDYECILVLRALGLRENDPERWMRLLNLDAPVDICMDRETASIFINGCVKFIREKCGLKQYSDNLIRQVASICYLNAFYNEDHPGDSGYIYKISTYIGDLSSKVVHSCIGNSEWAMISAEEDQISFRALVPIKAGDPITTVYNFKQLCHRSTQVRQEYLKEHYFFNCSCQRCISPNEHSTYVSAIKCSAENCDGYLLPLDPLNIKSDFSCDSPLCWKIMSHDKVQVILATFSKKLEQYPYKDAMRGLGKEMAETKRVIVALKKLVGKFSGHHLHPNHYLILEAEWKIMQNCYYYIMNVKQWTPDVVELMIKTGNKHLTIFNKLAPGINRRRGYILYYLQSGLLESIRHGTSSLTKTHKKKHVEPTKPEVLKKTYTEMMSMREETVKIFSFKGQMKNSMEEELVTFSAPDQPFISCLRFLERILDRTVET